MFANRYTAFIDACSLADVLRRNLLLSLAEAEFYRLRWSAEVLDETQRAIERILLDRQHEDAAGRATRARRAMEAAFEDAMVVDFEAFMPAADELSDPNDRHVLAAALKTEASMLVTENLKHFPEKILRPLNIEAKSSDAFIADTIALDPGRAVEAIRRMRQRLKRPEVEPDMMLMQMEARGLVETVDTLKSYAALL